MARLGALIPSYRMAAETFTELVGLSVASATTEEVTTVAGQRLRDIEMAISKANAALPGTGEECPLGVGSEHPALPEPDHLCVSLDGVMVNTDEGWREVKVVSVSEVEEREQPAKDEAPVILVNHGYQAGFWETKEFADVQWNEAQSRGVERANRVTSVNDGAPWVWALVLLCYPTALQVVDWWHLVERLWKVAGVVFGPGSTEAEVWVKERKDELWAGNVSAVVNALRKLRSRRKGAQEEIRRLKQYLHTHGERMRYQEFREQGAPVGSGTVESACKNVVGSRMKRGGMRWKGEGAEGVLALRCALLSNRWHEAWDQQRRVASNPLETHAHPPDHLTELACSHNMVVLY